MKSAKLKQIFVAGLTTLVFTYGCTASKNLGIVKESIVYQPSLLKPSNIASYNTRLKSLESLVISEASKHKVVMFGEAHPFYREDSDFVIRLLPELKRQGFAYLAIEIERNPLQNMHKTVSNYVSNGRIKAEEEFVAHLNIPGWLELIDAAKKEGMKIICYDTNTDETKFFNEREEGAFNNLKELIFNNEPDAKVVIYSGAAHISKKEDYNCYAMEWESSKSYGFSIDSGKKYKCLAYHINKYTNDKTLTVSLVGYDPIIHCDIALDLDKNECLKK